MTRSITRRRLLKGIGLGVAGAALEACAPTPAPGVAGETAAATEVTEATAPAAAETVVKLVYGTFAEATQLEHMSAITRRFDEETPGIEVEIAAKPWGQYWESIEVQVAGGVAPDVTWITPDYTFHYVTTGVLLDVTDYIEADEIDMTQYVGEAFEARFEGRYYGMPYGNGTTILAYNKTLFDEAGLDYPTKDWTWNEMREAATALTVDKDGDGNYDQWGLLIHNNEEHGWGPWVLSNRGYHFSGAVFTDKGGYFDTSKKPVRCTLNTPEVVQALKWVQENICDLGIQPKPGMFTLAPGVESPFNGGIVAMVPCGTWTIGAKRKVNFDWDIGYIPKSPHTGERRTTSYALPHVIFKMTKHPDAAWELIKWHAGEEAQIMLAKSGVKEPMLKTALEYLTGPPDHMKEVVLDHYLNYNWNKSTEQFEGKPEAESVMLSRLDYAWTCEQPIEQVVAEAENAVNDALEQVAD